VPAALPVELRSRAVAAYENTEGTHEEIAARFAIGVASLHRWCGLWRRTGSVEPKQHQRRGLGPKFSPEHADLLRRRVQEESDATHPELADWMEEQTGIRVDPTTIGRTLRAMGITRKKKR